MVCRPELQDTKPYEDMVWYLDVHVKLFLLGVWMERKKKRLIKESKGCSDMGQVKYHHHHKNYEHRTLSHLDLSNGFFSINV